MCAHFEGCTVSGPRRGTLLSIPVNTSSIGILQPSCIVSCSVVKRASGVLLANGDI